MARIGVIWTTGAPFQKYACCAEFPVSRQAQENSMKNMLCVSTKGVTSGAQLSEVVFMTVQEALYPHTPRRATEWLSQMTLVEAHAPWHDPAFPRVEEGCWRMLLVYALEDLTEHSDTPVVIADLPRLLNSIHFVRGRKEVLTVCTALQTVQRLYPQTFLAPS
jgi:hypothetical protein